jgi:endogenous inhibitor of DNA gyrase (YacG/DUF329 family)
METGPKKIVKCPICRKDVEIDAPDMPFCSDRCRIIDLGNWASEKYTIPSPVNPGDLDEQLDDEIE